jgi:hypothetical protein
MSAARLIVISGLCSHLGCKRVSVTAVKVSDFWVTRCDLHLVGKITVNMDKISAAVEANRKLAAGGAA